ncbi:MAG: HAMP domain-containing histidine kinase [gamma proteobacterium symbiont of Bathyaustriella thionipta]|nr:HAMP domain-containing histidine kinase [gamma proteobacterium symbiont of Bathyaustriella thionipta]MCU7948810.1 HAMP domain-containing histidine kinase [gamma proteobacterium symbiont of Bathyaustriella thionipta]MCU7954222.1 HAMP domain-containing histidine kinase [gamma proteobacterium symbiont of Bathyaustriella thionipta]MCU7955268.1 HAMP domain-containing histidine kinase [gamma proteobacterium symbiont of Bathyaustriella thionipta]MCU7966277.1 HAMP domain-containing histidine kinase 
MSDINNSDKTESSEQFNAVLMSFIHDIKNSLLMSLSSLETLYNSLDSVKPELKENISLIQYELQRINNSLVQLLSLYKMETHLFSIQADQYNIYDFLEDIIINNTLINEKNDFSINMECDDTIEWFFDKDLIATIINSTINNSTRYAHSQIKLSAKIIDEYLHICIEDDGEGFPKKMFVHPDTLETAINMKSGSTGLGLYFAEKIANIHHNGDKIGSTMIDNQSQLGGGRFKLLLP